MVERSCTPVQCRRAAAARTLPGVRRAPRRSVLALLAVAGATAVALPILASAAPEDYAPDLRADPVGFVSGPAVYSNTEGGLGNGRLLLRFDGYVTNIGKGPLEVSGNPQVAGGVQQLARTAPNADPSVPVASPEVRFETQDSHNHFHLMRAMRYSLWNEARTAQVAPAQKVGFCLYDLEDAPGFTGTQDPVEYTDAVTDYCEEGNQFSPSLRMGVSAGWRDVYSQALAFQWIDVSETAPGTYVVGAEADPDNVLWEGAGAAEVNAPAFRAQTVTVPGWVAQPVAIAQTGAAQAVPLAAAKFGTQSDANLRYRVVTPPAHGSLSAAAGQDFGAGVPLVYTPAPGYAGADAFTYVARSAASGFPTNPQAATVTIGDARSVAISGAPASMVAGTSAQLTATVRGLPGGVTWSATAGTVSAAGLYRAPGSPPAGGAAVVRASSAADPAVAAEVRIRITAAPNATAKPDPWPRLSAGRRLLSPLRARWIGPRTLVAKVTTGRKGGRVSITASARGKVLGRCAARVAARKGFVCRLTIRRGSPPARVRLTAKLALRGGGTVVRRAILRR